jgi:uncharacterized protein (DUF433 family)
MVVTLGVGTVEGGESSRTLLDPSTGPRLHGIFGSTKRKTMLDWRDHISSDPGIMVGKPCIKGTRITVDLIVEEIAHCQEIENLLEAYPHITMNDIEACIQFAAYRAGR